MNILDEQFGAQTEAVNLDTLIDVKQLPAPAPEASVRNRAAKTAMMSSPEKAVENYQLMMKEGTEGQDTTYQQITQNIQKDNAADNMKGVMSVLGDKNLSIETKRGVLSGIKKSSFLNDSGTILHSKMLSEPSVNDTVESESARLSTSDAIREIYDARSKIQGLVNAHGASLPDANAMTVVDMAAVWLMPLGESISTSKVAKQLHGKDATLWSTIKDFMQPGNAKADIVNTLKQLPPDQRVKYAEKVRDAVASKSGIIFSEDNHFAQFDKMTTIFNQGGYGDVQQFMDNVVPLLDIIGIGQIARGIGKGSKVAGKAASEADAAYQGAQGAARRPGSAAQGVDDVVFNETYRTPKIGTYNEAAASTEDQMRRIEMNSVVKTENPASTAHMAQQSNPDKARAMHETVVTSNDDQVAQGLYGTTREQAIINDVYPQIATETGAVTSKVNDIDKGLREKLMNEIDNSGAIYYTSKEKAQARANVVNDFTNAEGLHANDAMSSFSLDGGQIKIDAVYGTRNGGFLKAEDAFNQAKVALRKYGILDSEIEVLGKQGLDHVPLNVDFSKPTYYHGTNREFKEFDINAPKENKGTGAGFTNRKGHYFTKYREDAEAYGSRVVEAKLDIKNPKIVDVPPSLLTEKKIAELKAQGYDGVNYRDGEEIVAFDNAQIQQLNDGNYLVRVKTSHAIDPTDITKWDQFSVKRNLFDRIPNTTWNETGSVSRWLMDGASMVDPVYSGAASVASDATSRFEKMMLTSAQEYTDKFMAIKDKTRRAKIDDYIVEANYKGIPFDRADLSARGFSPKEMDALHSWKKFWDGHYYLENYDVVRTLNSQGYQMFQMPGIELYAKNINKDITAAARVFDPALDKVVTLSRLEMDKLYDAGGSLARLRRPADFAGDEAAHMIVRNTPTEYLRKFRDTDAVLNYRDGYYSRQYKAPRFVEEVMRDAQGVELGRKAVAVAGDTAEATRFADRMKAQNGKEYHVRGDERAMARSDDTWWDVNSASGRVAQRHRGKLLEDASGLNTLGDGSYVVGPVESAQRAARSISGRTVNRPMLEAAKSRAMAQYGKYFPPDGMGGVKWPKVSEISDRGAPFSKEIADARTTVEFINYQENGYINALDDTIKQGFNMIADIAGKHGLSKTERAALTMGEQGLTTASKQAVFMAYIGSNFLRQWVVQPHQVLRTWSYNPSGWLSGNIPKYITDFAMSRAMDGYQFSAPSQKFIKFVEDSGLLDAVDKSNLVRGTLLDAADGTNPISKAVKMPLNISRRIGFDVGEQTNLLGHAAAVYDKRVREGANMLDKTVRDQAYSEIRAISYDMNFAGDMTYNQTSLAVALQFLQVPHKAILQATNRRIAPSDRLKMGAMDMVIWGSPAAALGAYLGWDILPDNPELREAVQWGVESWALNKMWTELAGERVSVDYSSLAPYDMDGWKKFVIDGVMSGGGSAIITNSPAGQIFLKDGSRAQNALKAVGRYFGAFEDYGDDKETFLSMMNEVAKMSSGWNNAVKAEMALRMRKRLDQYGGVTADDVGTIEAIHTLFGFGSSDTRDLYALSLRVGKDMKGHKEDTLTVYKDIKRYYTERLGVDSSDPVWITKVSGFALKTFENDPVAQEIIVKQLKFDLEGTDQGLLRSILKRSGIPDLGGTEDMVKTAPIPQSQKDQIMEHIKEMKAQRAQQEKK